jgi:hypothetical protein
LKEHVGGTYWELKEDVENMMGTQWVQQKSTNVLPKEEFANSNYNIPLVLPM